MSVSNGDQKCVVSFHNISYKTTVTKMCCKKSEKHILRDVSGVFEPGVSAILGPSGGGKTSLLDILAKRRDVGKDEFSGSILLNGKPLPNYYKHIAALVKPCHSVKPGT